ncbi:hypothetical protein HK099_004875 [Clydaea vesicula]|uniref:Uncharacterized protein n=1 Tax=Clydaea vesicula TaxID=447962 RepID=A0AAD5UAG6_9FUNG|nr:hypothetical protein HK099_004875 [Clydaea vesicula]
MFQSYSRLDMIKRYLKKFVWHKNSLNENHEFGILVLTTTCLWKLNLTNNVEKVTSAIGKLEFDTADYAKDLNAYYHDFVGYCELGDVFKTLESEIDDDNAYLQLILFYSRSYVIPDIPSVDLLQKFHNSGKFVYDSIFFHEKVNNMVNSYFIY